MSKSIIQVRIDQDLKHKADELFNALGTDTTAAIRMFLTQSVLYNGIPFEIKRPEDPFYNEYNQKRIRKSIEAAEQGKLTSHDLIEGIDE